MGEGQPALLWACITFLDSGREQEDGRQRCGDAALLGSLRDRCVGCLCIDASRSASYLVSERYFFFSLSLRPFSVWAVILFAFWLDRRMLFCYVSLPVVSLLKTFSSSN